MQNLFHSLAHLLHPKPSDEISTVSTLSALMEGVYEGTISGAEMRKKGDFGLGTFDALDGELIMLDNAIYRATPDTKLSVMDDKTSIAYAVVKFFNTDVRFEVSFVQSMTELGKRIDDNVKLDNVMLAIKVTGKFENLLLRAVPKQAEPYPKFEEVAKAQTEISLENIRGILVGFRFPEYTGEVSVPGYHFHFVSEDKTIGGHVLNCTTRGATVECDISRELHAQVPDTHSFDCAHMHDHKDAIAKSE
jgi:acetolactate decarboxylase